MTLGRCRLSPSFLGVFSVTKRGSGRVVYACRRIRAACTCNSIVHFCGGSSNN